MSDRVEVFEGGVEAGAVEEAGVLLVVSAELTLGVGASFGAGPPDKQAL